MRSLKGYIVKLLSSAVRVLGRQERFADQMLAPRRESWLLGSMLVGVQRQYPRLRQQRPREAEQQ
jgi:hypothetical protein